MASRRFTVAVAVGIVTEDEQLASNFADLYLKACETVAQTMAKDEMFRDKLELFPIMPGEDDEIHQ
jgi:hypothetical protein